jgi:hypothetical protein
MANYTCPMHPDVISDRPGNCSKCNRHLEQSDDSKQTTTQRTGKPQPTRER